MRRSSAALLLASATLLCALPAMAADHQEIQALNQTLRDALRSHTATPADALSRRAILLRAAIRKNPASAQALLLQPNELATLARTSAAAKASVEAPASYDADHATIFDSSDWRSAYYLYRITTPEGQVHAYQDSNVGAPPGCGTHMRLEGYRIGDTMLVTNSTVIGQAVEPVCSTMGDQHAAVILISFPHHPISKLTVDQYAATFFSATAPSVNDFYREMSYGKTSVSGDVYGPYTLDRDYDSCADSSTVASLALAAADAAVDLTPYNRIFVVAPPATTCGFGGYSDLGCTTYTLANAGRLRLSRVYQFDAASSEILRTSPHELGHGVGLGHARTDALNNDPLGPDRTRMTYSEYGDGYSSMGGSGPHHFAAPHKVMLKWLDDDETAQVSSDQTADILPLSSPTHGLKGLRVDRRIGSKQYVWIEYRTATGYDASLAPNLLGGALIHFEDPSTGVYTELLDYGPSFSSAELRAGTTWSDPYSDLTIQVIEAAPDHLRVSVRHDPLCTVTSWPSQSTYGSDAFNLSVGMPQSTCLWTLSANNFWLQPEAWTAGDSAVHFDGAPNADPISRQGSVTADRQTFFVSQSPAMQPLSMGYFGPTETVAAYTPYEIGVALPNSSATLGAIDVLWNSTASLPGGCAFTYSFLTRTARLLDDSGTPVGNTLSTGQTSTISNTLCAIGGLSDSRTTPFFSNFYFGWTPKATLTQPVNVYYRFHTTPDTPPGDWQQGGGTMLLTSVACPVYSNYSLLTPTGSGATYTLSVSAAATCAWKVQTDADWVTAQPASGSGSARVTVVVASNPSNSFRQANVTIGQVIVPVQQYSSVLSGQPFVSFTQSELDVARAASSSTLQFSTTFSDGSLSWKSSSPWLRVSSYIVNSAGCPCVTVSWDSNVSNLPRQATLTAATLDGVPIQGSALHIVQDSGRLRPGDYQLSTVAGTDTAVDGQPAMETILKQPTGLALDSDGAILLTESDGNRVRRIAPDGSISTLAGTGYAVTTPYTGTARQVGVDYPQGVASDGRGNIYIASFSQIRVVRSDGSVAIVAGTGGVGFSGDGGPAAKALIYEPFGVVVAPDGTIYFSDTYNQRIRKVSPDGTISTVAGTGTSGYSGDGGPATSARINTPFGLALAPDGSLLIADRSNHRIRRITADGTISLVAGTGTCAFGGDGGPAVQARLCYPWAVTTDADGNIFVADGSNNRIRKITPDGTISTVAGNGSSPGTTQTGPATTTGIGAPAGIAVASNGDLYISDSSTNRIRVVHDGVVAPFAGLGNLSSAGDGGPATSASFYRPMGLAADSSGNLFVSDYTTNRVRKVSLDGTISNFAGTGQYALGGDGKAAVSAGVASPNGLAAAPDGSIFMATYCQIRKVDTAGIISVYAGSGTCGYTDNASPLKAQFQIIAGLALDANGNLYVADPSNQRVRMVAPDGTVSTVAGTGKSGAPVDGGPATSSPLNGPADVAVDAAGNLYIADRYNYCVRKVTPDGIISTFAGIPAVYGNAGDNGPATHARLGTPQALKFDGNGNLWVADTSFHLVRKIAPDGTITTVAGTGSAGSAPDNGPAWAGQLYAPMGLAAGPNGMYVSDSNNGRVRLLSPVAQ